MPEVDEEKESLSAYPWATLTAVLLTLIGAVVLVVGNSDLSFDQFTDYALAGWAALALGRGLAAKPPNDLPVSPLSRLLNSVPWATVTIGIIIITGAVVLLVGDSALAFDEYFQKCILAAGALGIARGVAAYKKDVNGLAGEVYSEPEYDPALDTAADAPLEEAEGKEKV